MSRAIEQAVSYTHNLRINYGTKIAAELEIKQNTSDPKDFIIKLPNSIPSETLAKYKKGMTIFIVGEEITSQLAYGIGDTQNQITYFDEAKGVKTLLTRSFIGSTANGGFYKIKDITNEANNKEIILDVPEDSMIEEKWIGIIALSAWRDSSVQLSPIVDYLNSALSGTGIVSERVKNYSYQVASGGDKIHKGSGLPKDLLAPLNSLRKLPNSYERQLKELIYV